MSGWRMRGGVGVGTVGGGGWQSSKASKAIYKPEEKQRLTLLYNCPKIHGVEIEAN